MSRVGAPFGNQNAKKGKRFQKAIERVLARKYGDVDAGYEVLAEKYIEMAEAKDTQILKDCVDRTDGKPEQSIEHSGDSERPIVQRIERVIVEGSPATHPEGI